jgi:hypothetical protein
MSATIPMNFHGYEDVCMNTKFFSWIISTDISMLLKIYGYEYEYAKFSWIFSMGNPIVIEPNCVGAPRGGKFGNKASLF